NVINEGNANQVEARLIVEGANGPTSRNADAILDKKGVYVVPDILANSGGVIVSYFEWVQDIGSYFWNEAQVNQSLKQMIVPATQRVWNMHKEKNINLRKAAMCTSIARLQKAMLLRGLYPR